MYIYWEAIFGCLYRGHMRSLQDCYLQGNLAEMDTSWPELQGITWVEHLTLMTNEFHDWLYSTETEVPFADHIPLSFISWLYPIWLVNDQSGRGLREWSWVTAGPSVNPLKRGIKFECMAEKIHKIHKFVWGFYSDFILPTRVKVFHANHLPNCSVQCITFQFSSTFKILSYIQQVYMFIFSKNMHYSITNVIHDGMM